MWAQMRTLQETGVTIILTTHYIEEAEEMAGRISVIHKGRLIITESKETLMQKMGKRQLIFQLTDSLAAIPASLSTYHLTLTGGGTTLVYAYNAHQGDHDISDLLDGLKRNNIRLKGIESSQTSLEEIFIQLVGS